ncbi:DsbE family thiol:disulfide interchange protein [Sphingomonas sp. ID0503]|uniref:DsbE family thiol:disulfide interchange protein n=1 Tax=Sphingomonas sp. ID0503 TaxID=3399691 RepID=UPI003AFB20FB
MKRLILWAPLVVFIAFIGFAIFRLSVPEDHAITSKLVGQPLPAFVLPPATPGKPGLSRADLTGRPRLLNIFASWCVPCAAESPQLLALKQAGVEIDAIAIRDKPEDVAAFLQRFGDPYARIGGDATSSVQMALGSSGVPESFVIDAQGIIRHQHIGDIREEHIPELLRQIEAAK